MVLDVLPIEKPTRKLNGSNDRHAFVEGEVCVTILLTPVDICEDRTSDQIPMSYVWPAFVFDARYFSFITTSKCNATI